MTGKQTIDVQKDAAITQFAVEVTLPLLADGPKMLGTGTLFTHEGRYFIVTAAHILKVDEDDPGSADIDLTGIAFPTGRGRQETLITLGSFTVHRPAPPSRVDVVVLELQDSETIATLKKGWRFLCFDAVAPFPFNARFILSGFPLEGATWDGQNVGQNFLTLATDPLHYVPKVKYPEPSIDRFFYLEDKGQLLDGSLREIPKLQGLSGASLWAYAEPAGLWSPATALKVVAVQSSYSRGKWIRCADWEAVRYIFNKPEIGFQTPP
ncbi:MAG: hypothetical protein QOG13_3260 [Sphingomonadales bacterium]|jgi:hypothetical protein|nr:hypothetical protein [Sphingomonadales bacterium]